MVIESSGFFYLKIKKKGHNFGMHVIFVNFSFMSNTEKLKQGPPYEATMVHNCVECKVKFAGEGCNVGKRRVG